MAQAQQLTAKTTGPECAICHMAFGTMNFVVPSAYTHSQCPPPHFEHALHLVNQGLHHFEAKMDVLHSLINSCAGPKTQCLNIAGS